MKNVEDVKKFIEKHKKFPKYKGNLEENESTLGKFIDHCKNHFKKNCLSKKRVIALKLIGIDLESNTHKSFEEKIKDIKLFIDEHKRLPKINNLGKYTQKNEQLLANFIHYSKFNLKKNKLSKEKQTLLESVGIHLETTSRIIKTFKENIEEIKLFKEKYNSLPKKNGNNSKTTNEKRLSLFISNCKKRFEKDKLSEEQKNMLESLGVTFEIKKIKSFEENINKIKLFKEEFKSLPKQTLVNPKSNNEYELALNINYYKECFRKNRLTKEKQKILESIGINLKINKTKSFEEKINEIKLFKEEYKSLPKQTFTKQKTDREYKLACFINTCKKLFGKNKLSKERQEILESLGIVFNKKDSTITHEF